MPRTPSRRAVLAAAAGVLVTGGLAGCGVRWVASPEPTPTVPRTPDDDARDAAVADARALAAVAVVRAQDPPPVQAAVTAVATATAAHLTALGDGAATSPTTGTATGQATGGSATGADPAVLLAALATAAGTALATAVPAGPGTARLLSCVAASRAVLLDGLAAATGLPAPDVVRPAVPAAGVATASGTSTTASMRGPDEEAALQRALAGEHAAVFAYGLVAGRTQARRTEALADLDAHRVARDRLVALLLTRGAEPVAAAPAYEAAAATPEAAALLASAVEERLAAAHADVVASGPRDRDAGADALLRAARAGARWGSPVRSFPGLPALGEDGRPVPLALTVDVLPSATAPAAPGTPTPG